MDHKKDSSISRREFARRAAFASAAVSLTPSTLLPPHPADATQPQQPANAPKLSPESQAEVDSRIAAIFALYGDRLSDTQKADVRRLATEAQPPLDRLRAFVTQNSDGPGLYLKPLIEHERKPAPTSAAKTATAPKSS